MPDYAALAKQAGAIASQPPASGVDYNALAKQAGAIDSQPAGPKDAWTRFHEGAGAEAQSNSPRAILQGFAEMTAHPIDTARGMLQAQADIVAKAYESVKSGD